MKNNNFKLNRLVGDYSWKTIKNILIDKLIDCETEKDFLKVIEIILKSSGDLKYLEKQRAHFGIHQFTKEDKDKMTSLHTLKGGVS